MQDQWTHPQDLPLSADMPGVRTLHGRTFAFDRGAYLDFIAGRVLDTLPEDLTVLSDQMLKRVEADLSRAQYVRTWAGHWQTGLQGSREASKRVWAELNARGYTSGGSRQPVDAEAA